jgi:hypothetical protein
LKQLLAADLFQIRGRYNLTVDLRQFRGCPVIAARNHDSTEEAKQRDSDEMK